MAPTGEAYNTDWVISNNSNVHVANNRDWFTSYTPFKTHFGPIHGNSHIEVAGIGTVELNLKLHKKKRSGQPNSRLITLHDVLYAPNAVCNIVGYPFISEHNIALTFSNGGSMKDENGRRFGLIEMDPLPHLRLHGQSIGSSSLDKDGMYMISAEWPDAERARWAGHHGEAPYTTEEKAWLKENYGGEFKFLQTHGLSIYKEEDRGEGRSIARTMMTESDSEPKPNGTLGKNRDIEQDMDYEDEDEDDSEDDDDADSFLRELEDDPMSHMADYNFSDAELKWIKKHWQYSSNFMLSYGLKPYETEDCEEAKVIIRAMMSED